MSTDAPTSHSGTVPPEPAHTSPEAEQTWLITGCSTGLGRALARGALETGHRVAVTARNPQDVADLVQGHPRSALALPLDVTDPAQVAAAVAATEDRFGAVDVLVNNAGYGLRSAVEEARQDEIRDLFDVNYLGAVRMIQAVLPGMRARGSGTVVNVSSMGARTTAAGSAYYAGTKAALEALTGSLRAEVGPLGIRAFSVEPGSFRTDFSGRSLRQSATEIDAYAETAGKRRKGKGRPAGTQPGDPAKAAAAILKAVALPDPPHLLVLGPDALTAVDTALQKDLAALDFWRETSLATDIDDA